MNKTQIEWVKNPDGTQGMTWNPITGCLNHTPEGLCLGGMFPCYAYKLANGRLRERYLANRNITPLENDLAFRVRFKDGTTAFDDPFYPRFWGDRISEPILEAGHKPKGIFPCDMSDLFGIGIPNQWTQMVMDTIEQCPNDRFYLLTKQPQNLIKFSPFPSNCWVGITCTDENMFNEAIINLADINASVKYISFEPLLDEVWFPFPSLDLAFVNWAIIGAQTKPYKPPKWEWVSEIIEACVKADIPYFLKDNLELIVPKVFGGDGSLIQEMPR